MSIDPDAQFSFTGYQGNHINLFDKDRAEPGWYNGSGQTSPDGAFCSSELIEVFEEDTVEFGAAVATQGWHMVIYNEQQQPIGDCTLSKGLTVLDTVDDQTVLISYTVPANVWYVRLICDARYKDTYFVTATSLLPSRISSTISA